MFVGDIKLSVWLPTKHDSGSYYRYERFGNHLFIFRARCLLTHCGTIKLIRDLIELTLEDELTRKQIVLGLFDTPLGIFDSNCQINKTVTKLTKLYNDVVPW
jgi:hypothetical protein